MIPAPVNVLRLGEDLVEALEVSRVELIVLPVSGDGGEEDGEEPAHHCGHSVEVVDPARVRDLPLNQERLRVNRIISTDKPQQFSYRDELVSDG